jgi:hypothetical protein
MAKEVFEYSVGISDVHGNNVNDTVTVLATDAKHAMYLAEGLAVDLYPLNQMGAHNPEQIRPVICQCGSVNVWVDGHPACRNWCD